MMHKTLFLHAIHNSLGRRECDSALTPCQSASFCPSNGSSLELTISSEHNRLLRVQQSNGLFIRQAARRPSKSVIGEGRLRVGKFRILNRGSRLATVQNQVSASGSA